MKPLKTIALLTTSLVFAPGCDKEGKSPAVAETEPPMAAAPAEVPTEPEAQVQTGEPVVITYVDYAVRPLDFVGATVEAEDVKVDEVISDRAFWLENQKGDRVLAIVREDVPAHEMIDINAGQRLDFRGLALTPGAEDDLAGSLEQDAKDAIDSVPIFIATHWRDVTIRND